MSKMVLTKEEVRQLETDMRIKSLIANYKEIQNGWDQSATAKIMVLDQIQTLKHDLGQQDIFDTIEGKLLKKLKMQSPEIQIVEKKKGMSSLIATKTGKTVILNPKKVKLTAKETKLSAHLSLEDVEKTSVVFNATIDKSRSQKYVGNDLCDKNYLLYLAVARGDHRNSALFLQDALECIENEDLTKLPKETALQIATLLNDLSIQMRNLDNTRSGIAKGFVLAKMADFILKATGQSDNEIYTRISQNLNKNLKRYERNYDIMQVEGYLPKDHIWVQALGRLKTAAEKLPPQQ